jgi:hypothetical protein
VLLSVNTSVPISSTVKLKLVAQSEAHSLSVASADPLSAYHVGNIVIFIYYVNIVSILFVLSQDNHVTRFHDKSDTLAQVISSTNLAYLGVENIVLNCQASV